MTIAPTQLRVEHFEGSLVGLGVACPRLSWRLPEGATTQAAYEIQADADRSKRLDGDRSVLVAWPFEPLQSRQAVTWRVRVWTDDGVSEWSAPARLEVGLLNSGGLVSAVGAAARGRVAAGWCSAPAPAPSGVRRAGRHHGCPHACGAP